MGRLATIQARIFPIPDKEAGPIRLDRRRIYVLPNRAGLAFATALLVMLIGAINYSLSLGHALVFVLAGVGVSSILDAFRNLNGLSISLGACDPVFAGGTARFRLILHSQTPRYRLRLGWHPQTAVEIEWPGTAAQVVEIPHPATQRGRFKPGRLTLDTTWPLGLIRAWAYLRPDMTCLVYPAPELDPPPLPMAGHDAAPARLQDQGRGSEDFAGLRDHLPGDSPRHIAWKALANSDQLYTKRFSGEGQARIELDWAALPPGLSVEARLSRLTAWLLEARRMELHWSFSLPDFHRPAGGDQAHFQACLEALALYPHHAPQA